MRCQDPVLSCSECCLCTLPLFCCLEEARRDTKAIAVTATCHNSRSVIDAVRWANACSLGVTAAARVSSLTLTAIANQPTANHHCQAQFIPAYSDYSDITARPPHLPRGQGMAAATGVTVMFSPARPGYAPASCSEPTLGCANSHLLTANSSRFSPHGGTWNDNGSLVPLGR